MATRAETQNIERFTDRYRLCCSPVRLAIESDALDADYGSTGYTTRAQADELAEHLQLRPGDRLADIGSGSGWPGLYLAQQTGCHVIGTDLPLDGLQRARARSIADGLAGRASYAMATGRNQPFRSGAFDAVVHTDVLCCLGPKLAVLRACHRLLRPCGRLAFTTIHVAPDLDARRHRRAVRAGPWQVATRRPYPELVGQAGFHDIAIIDVTEDYARTQRVWLAANESRAADVRRLISDREFETAQADRRYAQAAIEEGLLRRSLITATRVDPSPFTTADVSASDAVEALGRSVEAVFRSRSASSQPGSALHMGIPADAHQMTGAVPPAARQRAALDES